MAEKKEKRYVSDNAPLMAGQKEKRQNLTLTQEEFEKRVLIKNPNLKIISNYTRAREPISFRCLVCDNEQTVNRAEVLTRTKNYCPICNKKYRYNTKSFKEKISIVNPFVEILGEYVSNAQRIKCKCKLCGHVWNPVADKLMQGRGCPECNITGTSFVEQVFLWSLRTIYGNNSVLHRDKKTIGMELDIYIPSVKLAIEPGGWHWHKKLYARDILKHDLCKKRDIRCITIYDQVYESVPYEYPDDFWFYDIDLGKCLGELKSVIYKVLFDATGTRVSFSDSDWKEILLKAKEQNIKRHEIFLLKFQQINPSARYIKIKSLYFRNTDPLECECEVCGYGKNGEWVTTGQSLLQGHSCPFCAGQITLSGVNDLITKNTKLANEWDYEKNVLNPNNISANSHKKVWWKCKKCGYEWQASIKSRNKGSGCPQCAKKSITTGQRKRAIQRKGSLFENNPELSIQWHPLKNGEITPNDITPGSGYKAWWLCHSCGYEWEAIVKNRSNGQGCPQCVKKNRSKKQES